MVLDNIVVHGKSKEYYFPTPLPLSGMTPFFALFPEDSASLLN